MEYGTFRILNKPNITTEKTVTDLLRGVILKDINKTNHETLNQQAELENTTTSLSNNNF